MLEFERIALVNNDIEIVADGIDALFEHPREGFALAAAPNGGFSLECTAEQELAGYYRGTTGGGAYVNSGVIVLRPSAALYRAAIRTHRCLDWSSYKSTVIDEQMLLNTIFHGGDAYAADARSAVPLSIPSRCLPSAFNCLEGGSIPCSNSRWPTVLLRHFVSNTKPLLKLPEHEECRQVVQDLDAHELERASKRHEKCRRIMHYLDTHDRARRWVESRA
jgi:hypothetical protein